MKIESYIAEELKKYHIPGMGISVSVNGESLIHKGIGYANLETKAPIEPESAWGIASCSKAFTSAIIAMLVDKGLLDYDQPIRTYLPDFCMDDEIASRECTIRDMLLHRTGLSEHDAVWADEIDRSELYKRFRYLKSRAPFRSKMMYNNTVYTIIGAIAEKVSGMSWEEMIEKWIFEPLRMTGSRPCLSEIETCEKIAMPYWDFGNGDVRKIPFWNVSPGDPCGGIVSNLNDAIKWVEFQCRNGKTEAGKQLIPEELMDEMHRMQITRMVWPWKWDEIRSDGGYALGWCVSDYRGYNVVFHTGEIEGYCTLFAFIKEKGIAYASYVNLHKPCKPPLFSILYTVLDEILGLPKVNWSEKFYEKRACFGGIHQHWKVDLLENANQVKGTMASHALKAYEGVYHHPGYGNIKIVEKDGKLYAQYRTAVHELEHFHYDTFKMSGVKEDTILLTAPLTFLTDPYTGDISELKAALDPESESLLFKNENR